MMLEPITVVLLFLIGIMWAITVIFPKKPREGFEGGGDTYEDPSDIYDDFYAKVYDKLFSTPERVSFEKASFKELAFNTFSSPETKILDVCCGTSPHAKWISEEGFEIVGADNSEAMLKKARINCPSGKFYRTDVTNGNAFPPKSFSHALLLYFSIYQFRNQRMVVDNIYQWLKPGGFFIVHLVDPDKFDPILSAASPFPAFSLQKYSKERVTDSEIFFNEFNYRAKFIKDNQSDDSIFEETFTFNDDSRPPRENKHRLSMPKLNAMIDNIRASGFTYKESVDMTSIGYEYQYLVYFTK